MEVIPDMNIKISSSFKNVLRHLYDYYLSKEAPTNEDFLSFETFGTVKMLQLKGLEHKSFTYVEIYLQGKTVLVKRCIDLNVVIITRCLCLLVLTPAILNWPISVHISNGSSLDFHISATTHHLSLYILSLIIILGMRWNIVSHRDLFPFLLFGSICICFFPMGQ